MTAIKLKRVYEEYDDSDGYRILVDKLWPRGMKKENLHYDLWAKNITPSPDLRKWFHIDPVNNWEGFYRSYLQELQESKSTEEFLDEVAKHKIVTLLYASKDLVHNHAIILKQFIEKELAK